MLTLDVVPGGARDLAEAVDNAIAAGVMDESEWTVRLLAGEIERRK